MKLSLPSDDLSELSPDGGRGKKKTGVGAKKGDGVSELSPTEKAEQVGKEPDQTRILAGLKLKSM